MSTHLYPPLRPQSIPEVLDNAFKIFSRSLLKVLPYGMLMTLVGQLGNIYNLASGRPMRRFLPRDPTSWLLYVLSLLLSLALWAALLLRQRAIAEGAPVSMRAELATVLQRLPALMALTALNALVIVGGAILLIVPALYLVIALLPSAPALVLDNKGPIDALKYSLHLVRHNWWRALAILAVMIVIVFVFYVLGGVFAAIAVQFERGADIAVVTATSTVFIISLGAFSAPFIAAVMLALLGDLKARREPHAAGLAGN